MRYIIITLILSIICLISVCYFSRRKILVIGDSISEPYGLEHKDGWVYKLNKKVGIGWKIINDSKSGRMAEEYVPKLGKYDVVILELGANDIFWKGIDCIPELKQKLIEIIRFYQKNNTNVLLSGIVVGPPHVDGNDVFKTKNMYKEISEECNVKLVPFILANVDNNFLDGYHPNPKGHNTVTENIWSHLKHMLT